MVHSDGLPTLKFVLEINIIIDNLINFIIILEYFLDTLSATFADFLQIFEK